MRLAIDSSRDPVEVKLEEPDDFKAFDVSVQGGAYPREALAAVGQSDDDGAHVFVEPSRLLELAGERAADTFWLGKLDQMLSYAAKHGWVDEGGRVRAHVVSG